jgi:hypothetical protein
VQEWVHSILPLKPSDVEVVATGTFEGKGDVLKERGIRYYVEDCLAICYMLREQAVTPILFRQPWNRASHHPFREVSTWAEIRALVARHPG